MVEVTRATREKSKLRIALAGVSGGGKTLGALLLASGLTCGDFSKVCLIDTEHRRGELYANRTDLGVGEFWYIELKAPYSPEHYKECVDAAVKQVGPDGVVIVDSLSHAWSNAGGVLEIKADIAAKPGKNSYTAWDEAGRIQNDFINYLLSVNCHTICTLRVKQDYVLTENDRGKQVPVKVGLAPVQRDDVEYEFDIMFTIGRDHIATTSKDVTFLDGFGAVITSDLGKQLAEWANDGKEPTRCQECGRLVSATRKRTGCSRPATPGARSGRMTCWTSSAASPRSGAGAGLLTIPGSPTTSRPPLTAAAGASSASTSPKAVCPSRPSAPMRWRISPARRMPAALRWWRCAGTALPWTATSRGITSATASRVASAAA